MAPPYSQRVTTVRPHYRPQLTPPFVASNAYAPQHPVYVQPSLNQYSAQAYQRPYPEPVLYQQPGYEQPVPIRYEAQPVVTQPKY